MRAEFPRFMICKPVRLLEIKKKLTLNYSKDISRKEKMILLKDLFLSDVERSLSQSFALYRDICPSRHVTDHIAHSSIHGVTVEQSISHDIILFTSLGTGETLIPRSLFPVLLSSSSSRFSYSPFQALRSPVGHVTPWLPRTLSRYNAFTTIAAR